jgi:uncharacterized protein with ParB-like and HNH nuclease domain
MKASEAKIVSMLEGNKKYIVPLFQRSYSWTKKEWNVLWDDVLWISENNIKSHFMGSIVIMQLDNFPQSVPRFFLIDGQQRMTTILIFFSVLRDLVKLKNEELAQRIEDEMLVNRHIKSDDYFKLMPTQEDNPVFKNIIKKNFLEINGDHLMVQCYNFFEKKLKYFDVEKLENIYISILSKFDVVSVLLNKEDNPYLVFESLNAKGKSLTQSDLIRNFIFMKISDADSKEAHSKYWKPMEDQLLNLTDFIGHYIAKDGIVIRKNDIYFTFKEIISSIDPYEKLKEIYQYSIYYLKMTKPSFELDVELQEKFERLNKLEITIIYPFLLNCYFDYDNNNLKKSIFLEILSYLENFLLRRAICNLPSNALNKFFPHLYKQCKLRSEISIDNLKLEFQKKGYPEDEEFKQNLISNEIYGQAEKRNRTKLLLTSIEKSFLHKEKVDFDNITIEHIMPQTLSDLWKESLGENYEEIHKKYLNTIGNLTLTGYNVEMSNKVYEEKRKFYLKSHLEINKYFSAYECWDGESITKRAEILSEKCLKIWPYFGVNQIVYKNVTNFKKPTKLKIKNFEKNVKSWKELNINVLEYIIDNFDDKFDILTEKYPKLINADSSKLREPRILTCGLFAETHFSSADIIRNCNKFLNFFGIYDWDYEAE